MNSRGDRARDVAEQIRDSGRYRWVGIYDVTRENVALIGFAGPTAPAYPVFSVEQGLTAVAIRTREPVISNDVAADSHYLATLESTGSEMIVPLVNDDGVVIGTVDVESADIGAFDERDLQLIRERLQPVRAELF